jgi:DNA-binding CsgD family transcriptional regulator
LPQRTREVVTILAVGSRPMRPSELAVVASEDASALRDHLWTAVDAGVLESGRDGTFWFRHPLNAEVLEEAVPVDVRGRWHAAFADLLESELMDAGGARVSAVAEHRYRAGDLAAAYGWALRAASWHDVEGAHAEGVRMLRRALALREQVDATESVGELLALIRVAAAKGGLHEEELRAVDEILANTSPEAQPGKVAELLVRRTHLHFSTGRAFFEQDDLREAVRLSASQPTSPEHALALAVLAEAESWHGNTDGVERARGALAIAREAGDDRALAFALSANAVAALSSGDAATGLRFAGEALDAGLRARDWWACAGATFWMANCSGTWSSADHTRAMSSGRERLARAGAPHAYLAWIASAEAGCWLAIGAWQECAARLRETLATDPGVLADVSSRLAAARLAAWQGRQREAEQHLARADELFAQRSGFLAFGFDVVRAEVRLGAPDPEGAYLAAMAGINVPDSLPDMCEWLLPLAARALADRAQVARDAGHAPAEALALADELQESHPVALRDFGYTAFPTYERQCRALDELYAAELSRARAESCEGELWVIAADSLGSMSMAWEEAYACRRGAEALLSRGQARAAGSALLRKGLSLAEALAAAPLVGELRALALRARVPIRKAVVTVAVETAAADAAIRLTPREREILALLVSGRTYGEIATQLVISEKTVSSHVSNLLAKTGTSNRVELAGYADRSGLTTG